MAFLLNTSIIDKISSLYKYLLNPILNRLNLIPIFYLTTIFIAFTGFILWMILEFWGKPGNFRNGKNAHRLSCPRKRPRKKRTHPLINPRTI